MSAYNRMNEREEAVRKSAEWLRAWGAASFPLDMKGMISAFGRQVLLRTYAEAEKEGKYAGLCRQSRDGFCVRVENVLLREGKGTLEGPAWIIFYNEKAPEARIRFTLAHETGHIALAHHRRLGTDALYGRRDSPEYAAAERRADAFAAGLLAPAPAAERLLREHGFAWREAQEDWQIADPEAPMLRNLGKTPNPEVLLMAAFGLSQPAANRRLAELAGERAFWEKAAPALRAAAEKIPQRAGWICTVCGTRRRGGSRYCTGCGNGFHYAFRDPGAFSRPGPETRENGQFEFCSVCGNREYPAGAAYCPVCGAPVVNECENALHPDGDFIRSGMEVIRGTHRCRPTDIYCGECGMVTAFGRRHGPRKNMWLPADAERCRTAGTAYAPVFAGSGVLEVCPDCGSRRRLRGGYCAECMQPLENGCAAGGHADYTCSNNDRFCGRCGSPTVFGRAGLLPGYMETEEWVRLEAAEKEARKKKNPGLRIREDGEEIELRRV